MLAAGCAEKRTWCAPSPAATPSATAAPSTTNTRADDAPVELLLTSRSAPRSRTAVLRRTLNARTVRTAAHQSSTTTHEAERDRPGEHGPGREVGRRSKGRSSSLHLLVSDINAPRRAGAPTCGVAPPGRASRTRKRARHGPWHRARHPHDARRELLVGERRESRAACSQGRRSASRAVTARWRSRQRGPSRRPSRRLRMRRAAAASRRVAEWPVPSRCAQNRSAVRKNVACSRSWRTGWASAAS